MIIIYLRLIIEIVSMGSVTKKKENKNRRPVSMAALSQASREKRTAKTNQRLTMNTRRVIYWARPLQHEHTESYVLGTTAPT